MYLCRGASIKTYTPDLSHSGQSNPTWFRAMVNDVELCNGLNGVDWVDNPVQVRICDGCGHKGCESGGYVHVSVLKDAVLWTLPQIDEPEDWELTHYEASYAVRKFGAIVIPAEEWGRWRSNVNDIPALETLPPTNGRALADAWRMTPNGFTRVEEIRKVTPLLENHLLWADTLDPVQAIAKVNEIVTWLESTYKKEIKGTLKTPESANATVETLYFGGPPESDWPALALAGGKVLPAFGKDCVFVPEE